MRAGIAVSAANRRCHGNGRDAESWPCGGALHHRPSPFMLVSGPPAGTPTPSLPHAQIARAYADNTERLATAFDSLYASLTDTQKPPKSAVLRSASAPCSRLRRRYGLLAE